MVGKIEKLTDSLYLEKDWDSHITLWRISKGRNAITKMDKGNNGHRYISYLEMFLTIKYSQLRNYRIQFFELNRGCKMIHYRIWKSQ